MEGDDDHVLQRRAIVVGVAPVDVVVDVVDAFKFNESEILKLFSNLFCFW